jgi:hypothetical protein
MKKLCLLNKKPKTEAEVLENLQILQRSEEVHRLQQSHHQAIARDHANQAAILNKLSITHPVAKIYQGQEAHLAEQHNKLLSAHTKHIQQIKELQRKQKKQLQKLRENRPRSKPKVIKSKKSRKHKTAANYLDWVKLEHIRQRLQYMNKV